MTAGDDTAPPADPDDDRVALAAAMVENRSLAALLRVALHELADLVGYQGHRTPVTVLAAVGTALGGGTSFADRVSQRAASEVGETLTGTVAATGPRAGDTAPDDEMCPHCLHLAAYPDGDWSELTDYDRDAWTRAARSADMHAEQRLVVVAEAAGLGNSERAEARLRAWLTSAAGLVSDVGKDLLLLLAELDRVRSDAAALRAAGDALADAKNWVGHVVMAERWRSATGSPTPAEPPAVPLPVTLSSVDDVAAVCEAAGLTEPGLGATADSRTWTDAHGLVRVRAWFDEMQFYCCALVDVPFGVDMYRGTPVGVLVAAIEAARGGSR